MCPRGVALPAPSSIGQLVREHGGEANPAAACLAVTRVTTPEDARSALDLSLLLRRERVAAALAAPGPVLVATQLAAAVPAERRWLHPHPLWALAGALAACAAPELRPLAEFPHDNLAPPGAGPAAVVLPGAQLGPGCSLGPGAVIYPGVTLGARVAVGAGSVVGRPGFGWASGPDGSVRRVPQLGGVMIEDDVELGPLCSVDAGTLGPTRIGRGSKLDAQVHVGHNVQIGPGCLIAAQVGFAGSSSLGADCRVGGQAGFADHVRVGDRVSVAGKAGVIRDVPSDSVVAGFPAVARTRWLRAMAMLTRLADRRS